MQNKLILLLLSLSLIIFCKKETQNTEIKIDTTTDRLVIADGGLHLREKPDQASKSILLIPNHSIVTFLNETGEKKEINGYAAKWNQISYGDKTGYVYGAFISPVKILGTEKNPKGDLTLTFYTILSDANPGDKNDCTQNYMAFGCVIVIRKSADNTLLSSFDSKIAYHWIDNDHIAEEWIIGDAGYGGFGVRSVNVRTKAETDLWKREEMMDLGSPEESSGKNEFNRLCIKTICLDLNKNADILSQLKTNPNFKYYTKSTYKEKIDTYSTPISIDEKKSIEYIPSKNIIIEN